MPGTIASSSSRWAALAAGAAAIVLGACTSVAKDPYEEPGAGPSPSELAVDVCNPIGRLQCIYLTGKETLEDGAQLKWTRHWWRMSYIGRACERQYGRTTGVILEGLFAIPHYSAMAIGNGLATLAWPFRNHDDAYPVAARPPTPRGTLAAPFMLADAVRDGHTPVPPIAVRGDGPPVPAHHR